MKNLISTSSQAPTCRQARLDWGVDACDNLRGSKNIRAQTPAPRRLLAAAAMASMDVTLSPIAVPGSGTHTPDTIGEDMAGGAPTARGAAAACASGHREVRRRMLGGAPTGAVVGARGGTRDPDEAGDGDEDSTT